MSNLPGPLTTQDTADVYQLTTNVFMVTAMFVSLPRAADYEARIAALKAGSADEIIFVRGATEGLNLVAQSWGRRHLSEGDEIVARYGQAM